MTHKVIYEDGIFRKENKVLNEKGIKDLTNTMRNIIARTLRNDMNEFLIKQQTKMNELIKLYTESLGFSIEDKTLINGITPIIQISVYSPQIVIEEDKSKDIFNE